MSKTNIKRWVKALRTTKKKQGRGALCMDNKYCCLGIACETYQAWAIKNKKRKLRTEDASNGYGQIGTRYDGNSSFLPDIVTEWLGLQVDSPLKIGESTAVGLNDSRKLSFKQIANEIEKHLL